MSEQATEAPRAGTLSRRRAITLAGVGAAGVAGAAAGAGALLSGGDHAAATDKAAGAVPFHGEHQAGITTPAQDRLHFVAFDVITKDRAKLVALLQEWTAAAARMTAGKDAGLIGAVGGVPEAPPDDTGEALGLPPSQLTLTVGFGPTLFRDAEGKDRFGIADKRPAALADLPHFAGDALKPEISGGDICVQACANDPQVAVHAIRNLARIGMGVVSVRWSQLGFGRTSSTSRDQATPRNLFGFKDGTANLKAEDAGLLREQLWAQPGDGADWMAGGSYLVTRKIRMLIETWDRSSLAEQEQIVGRTKGSGAPLGKAGEFDEPDFAAKGDDGQPVIAETAHVRLAHPGQNNGAHLLRRGYNFVDGSDGLGRLDAGLFFMAYQRDPRRQFVPIQTRLARQDAMNEYLRHVSSGIFGCPPGVRDAADWWGRALFS
ncbi:iron uptake transporter deferrochelatase/peroxidase subunit [Micromonospora sp. DR5-3]|uniref:iron uptake transporter deferrochelatase/peroxidase subunit n=1 Tax=unclassified Micromonospora TaxID=2617518 RepID=UPI0011D78958|nr:MULTISPECIES: iron uptake transporter deferrochelatase/peroxidase subunit [unclassified Micromonospora]MCW3814698.1 iron uptake transporter deferrochelatase/peroxidase subunit [Micromonospora sp. DR5-3]TYC23489.1 deferrochelatase/peroxidase EfeB [Micromonospora sp. MP36]